MQGLGDAENHFKEDTARLETILASIREAVVITKSDGTIIAANPATELITGTLPQELIGKRAGDVLAFASEKADVSGFLAQALEGWRAVELPKDSFVKRPRGVPVPLAATATPLYDSGGEYAGIVLVMRDLTEEAKLKKRQYEFLSFVSHQLRQPIGSLRWGLELVLEDKESLNPRHRELLEDLLDIGTRFALFIKDLIDISRFEEGRMDFKMEPVDIREVIQEVAHDLRGTATSRNVAVQLLLGAAPEDTSVIRGDRARVRDVFSNLLTNAILYNNPHGNVTIEVQLEPYAVIKQLAAEMRGIDAGGFGKTGDDSLAANRLLLVKLSDTGLGIPEDQQASMFESFFRGRNVTAKGLEGSGLGLFIVKSIIEHLGGAIFFTSKENEGTTFYLVFPLYEKV